MDFRITAAKKLKRRSANGSTCFVLRLIIQRLGLLSIPVVSKNVGDNTLDMLRDSSGRESRGSVERGTKGYKTFTGEIQTVHQIQDGLVGKL